MHEQELREALIKAKGSDSWGKLARRCPVDWPSLASRLADIGAGRYNKLSPDRRNELRAWLGLPPEPCPVEVMPCRTCGEVHSLDDCKGKRGELKIIKPRRRKAVADYTSIYSIPTQTLAWAIANREEVTV